MPQHDEKPHFALSETVFTIEGAAVYLDLSRAGVYRQIQTGKLKAFKIGGATRIHGAELKRFVDRLAGL